ncbi:Uncharacterized protein BM_BM11031 [Brugia malayi]|uniref:Bm11031 n=2 Tax=Brugia TaxID=6278 RepID=A0A0K0IQD2_BRUMA|nr:Uncharacterized protein BM_BM11031 [Brugia malayi]CRZ26062.1 Bm11031 [Brugia malayi]VIO89575.1 Uncharacterized protein BM_BM11031 [Brugia malayi]
MSSVAKILRVLIFRIFVFISGVNSLSNSQPMDYYFDNDDARSQPDRPIEWNTEYKYGRNYKHSEGQEWGTGYNNQYSTANMKKRPKLLQVEVSPARWTSPPNIDESTKMHAAGMYEVNAGSQHASMLPSNILKKQFQEKFASDVENWHNWPKKNITWSNWLFKRNQYEKQQVPWWDTSNQPKQKQPFWPGSIGWTGDLGPYGEVPPPPWLS